MNAVIARENGFANPWIWLGVGFLSCLAAAALPLAELNAAVVVALAVTIGLALVGIALTIRLNSTAPPFVEHFAAARPILFLGMALFQFGGAMLVCWSLLAAFLGIDPLSPNRSHLLYPPPLRPGLAIVLWLLVVPMSMTGAAKALGYFLRRESWSVALETGALLMFAALASLSAGIGLARSAESLAFFLSVLTAFLSVLVSFAIVSRAFQRLILSAAILFHFGAIANATLAAPPSPWILGQLWTRLSRPYLEFMYLNNAYHFYSPDPGPATYIWFRLFYISNDIDPETNQPKLVGHWVKVPDVKDDGTYGYRVALEYQRHLSLTENVIQSEPPPPLYTTTPAGEASPAPHFESRLFNSPLAGQLAKEIVGKPKRQFVLEVPFHPEIPYEMQYQKPNVSSLRMFETYVRHIGKTPHPMHPEWPINSIKVYRVVHIITLSGSFANGQDPQDPMLYRPFYMGHYLPDGKLVDPNEPLLYWLLPMWRHAPVLTSPICSWAAVHANDPLCDFHPTEKKWIEPKKEAAK